MNNNPFIIYRKGSAKALATVTAIIDGTGSIGAAVGPFLAGAIPGKDTIHQLNNIFYMLMAANVISLFVRSFQNYHLSLLICNIIFSKSIFHCKSYNFLN